MHSHLRVFGFARLLFLCPPSSLICGFPGAPTSMSLWKGKPEPCLFWSMGWTFELGLFFESVGQIAGIALPVLTPKKCFCTNGMCNAWFPEPLLALLLGQRCCSVDTKMLRLSRCGKDRKCSEAMAQMCWETGERACILCPPCFSPTPFLCSFLFLFSDSSVEPELSPVQKHAKYKMCEKHYCLKTRSFPHYSMTHP